MDFAADHFALFDLPQAYALDIADLEGRYRDMQAKIHPDRYADATEAERRLALQWATRVNEAFQTLKKPLSRAQYLLHLRGCDLGAESNTAMPADFLIEQMEWREAVGEAREAGQVHELETLHERLRKGIAEHHKELARLLDDARDNAAAAELTRKLMFLDKLLHEIDAALESLEA